MKLDPKIKNLGLFVAVVVCIGIIFLLNFSIIQGWMNKNGPANLGSIEVSYVSMGRFLSDFGLISWAPFWYFGFPFHLFYTPLLPFLETFLHQVVQMPLWESYRNLTGLAYIIGPISVFFLAWQLSKKLAAGLMAGLVYSVVPTVFYFLSASKEVAGDVFSPLFYDPRRFTILVRWGEGPHLFSLIFLPLVGVFFARLLENKSKLNLILASVFLGLTALSNAIGLFAALMLIAIMAFVKLAQSQVNQKQIVMLTFGCVLLALGLISWWFNLSFIGSFFNEGGKTSKLLFSFFPWGWVLGGIALGLIYFLVKRVICDFGLAVSILWFVLLFLVVYVYYASAPGSESEARVEILPQALRYTVEVDLASGLLIGVFFGWLIKYTQKTSHFFVTAGWIVVGIFVLIVFAYINPYLLISQKAASNLVDIQKTQEFKISSWLKSHVNEQAGERVFMPGNYGFYLNWFSNIWQLRGGLFQASTHRWPDHIYYQLSVGDDKEIARAWLTVMNSKYAVITATGSAELYKDIKNLDRFNSYPVVETLGGDIIYQIPQVRPSQAKPVNLDQMKSLLVPVKADDKAPLLAYANWVDNSSKSLADFKFLDNDDYQIKGKVNSGEGILVQMTADSGWRAYDKQNRYSVQTGKDPLGFLVLYPKVGDFEISLRHGTSWEEFLGYLIEILTVIFVILKLINFDFNRWIEKLKSGQKLA
ncbi:hypothetical protein HY025_03845 [Candidatus Daviesbacteria bacterium]|nr:hypothetical protein [Candidatus Daviesbacteria bacterium]